MAACGSASAVCCCCCCLLHPYYVKMYHTYLRSLFEAFPAQRRRVRRGTIILRYSLAVSCKCRVIYYTSHYFVYEYIISLVRVFDIVSISLGNTISYTSFIILLYICTAVCVPVVCMFVQGLSTLYVHRCWLRAVSALAAGSIFHFFSPPKSPSSAMKKEARKVGEAL